MNWRSGKRLALAVAVLAGASAVAPAQAEDFFSALFGGFGGRSRAPQIRLPFGDDRGLFSQQGDARPRYGGGQAYCVRTCDGRYFPINASDNQSRAASCNSFCPASDTKIVYGSSIDNAATENGKPYSELPNAFRYRNETGGGLHLQRQGPGRAGEGRNRQGSDAAQGRHRRRREQAWWSSTVAPTDAAPR